MWAELVINYIRKVAWLAKQRVKLITGYISLEARFLLALVLVQWYYSPPPCISNGLFGGVFISRGAIKSYHCTADTSFSKVLSLSASHFPHSFAIHHRNI